MSRRSHFQESLDPQPGQRIFRGQQDNSDDAGIFWTTDPDVVGVFAHPQHPGKAIYHATLDDPATQTFPRFHQGERFRSVWGNSAYSEDESNDYNSGDTLALKQDAEVRLVPGTQVRVTGKTTTTIKDGKTTQRFEPLNERRTIRDRSGKPWSFTDSAHQNEWTQAAGGVAEGVLARRRHGSLHQFAASRQMQQWMGKPPSGESQVRQRMAFQGEQVGMLLDKDADRVVNPDGSDMHIENKRVVHAPSHAQRWMESR